MEIKLHPKIDVEECLRNGYISADDYRKTHIVKRMCDMKEEQDLIPYSDDNSKNGIIKTFQKSDRDSCPMEYGL